MNKFVTAPSRVLVSQLVRVRTVYDDIAFVFRPQLDSTGNTFLKLYQANGVSIDAWNERHNIKPSDRGAFLHRDNIAEVL